MFKPFISICEPLFSNFARTFVWQHFIYSSVFATLCGNPNATGAKLNQSWQTNMGAKLKR